MQLPEFDILYQIAELAIGLAGFASLAAFFRQRESARWAKADADRFHGLIIHTMAAMVFCLLPTLIGVFTDSAETIWTLASTVLGLQIAFQVITVWRLSSTRSLPRALILATGGTAGVLQALNVTGVGFPHEFAPYLAGILWHLLQGAGVFIALVWIRSDALLPEEH